MTDYDKFVGSTIEPREAALLGLVLFGDLPGLLRKKGILTADDVTGLLEAAAHNLGESKNALAKRGGGFVRNTILPEHDVE